MLRVSWRFRSWSRGLALIPVLCIALLAGAWSTDGLEIGSNVADVAPRQAGMPILIPEGEPIVVGVSAALTGPIGSRGLEIRDAVVVAIERWKAENSDQIKGHDITVYAEDGSVLADAAAFGVYTFTLASDCDAGVNQALTGPNDCSMS